MTTTPSLLSTPLLLLLTLIYSTTSISAQLSPVQAPAATPTLPQPPTTATSPPAPPAAAPVAATAPVATAPVAATAPAPGFNTVPLVPVTPGAAPTPAVVVPKAPTFDIVQILRKAKKFSVLIRLLKTTQLINQLNSQLATSGGLTVFAPDDAAFSKLKAGFLNSLGDRQKVELLQFHTISTFISISNFDTLTNPVQTQAGDDPKRLQLNVTTYGGSQVSMTTGAVNASVTGTVYTDSKLAIYQVDKVLLPLDIVLPKAAAPAPSVAAAKGDSPKSDKTKSAGADQSAGDDNGDSDGNSVPVDSSMSLKVEVMWVRRLVLVVAVVGLAMI